MASVSLSCLLSGSSTATAASVVRGPAGLCCRVGAPGVDRKNATSILPVRKASSGSSTRRITRAVSGWSASQLRISATVWDPSADQENPTRNCEQALVVAAIASSTLRRMRWACSHRTRPAAVSSRRRVVRSTRRVPSRFSNWLSVRDKAGCATCRVTAAALIDPLVADRGDRPQMTQLQIHNCRA